jgi:hypothetical protein
MLLLHLTNPVTQFIQLLPHCRRLWDNPRFLDSLLMAAEQRAAAWEQHQQQHKGAAWAQWDLGELLHGFFSYYSNLFTDWLLRQRRYVLAVGTEVSTRFKGEG